MAGYITVITALLSFGITALLGIVLVPFLKRLKFGQTIKDIGPTWHKHKQGIPTMGGLMFIFGVFGAIALSFCYISIFHPGIIEDMDTPQRVKLLAGLGLALEFGFVGFIDDYIKVVKKRNLGLKARQKTVMQVLIAIGYLFIVSPYTVTAIDIPFLGSLELGLFYYPIMVIFIYFLVNAVNLTDGVDGLAGSVTFVVAIIFMVISAIFSFSGMGLYATALAGGCLGFLMWNFHPAKVFMGDIGSMFLGGAVIALGFGCGIPVFLALIGIIYFIEALSVVIQVISFKTTGKRVFKMSPIHHHFEMMNWKETKIVMVFSAISVITGSLAVVAAFNL